MKRIYLFVAAILLTASLAQSQDTLTHFDIFSAGGVQTPPETNAFPNNWGFKYGHGSYGLTDFAEKYSVSEEKNIIGVMVLLGESFTGANSGDNAHIEVYAVADSGAPAANPLVRKNVPMTSLSLGLNAPTIVMLDEPYAIEDSFYVSFGFPEYDFITTNPNFTPPNDTLAVYSTGDRDNDPNPNIWYRNAVRYSADYWSNPQGVGIGEKMNFCISPIIAAIDTTSIDELTISSNIRVNHVYPNPVDDHVNIQMSVEKNTQARIALFDMGGRSLGSRDYNLNPGEHLLRLDIADDVTTQQIIALIQTNEGMVSLMLQKK